MSIRPATEGDLSAMLDIYRPYVENTAFSFEYRVPTREEFACRFREHTADFPWLVWEEEGQVLGYAYAGAPWERAAYRWCAEISVYLDPGIHGRGIGRRLYGCIEQILTGLGYRQLYALVTTENEGSLTFHRRLGYEDCCVFENCGYKMGRWLGIVWLRKQLLPLGAPEAFPAPWDGRLPPNLDNLA